MRAVAALTATLVSVGAAIAALAAAAALLSGCGGEAADEDTAHSTVLDIDALGSIDAAALEAAAARGAPGDGDPRRFLVRAHRLEDAEQAVRELIRLGFGPVEVVAASDRGPGAAVPR